MEATQTYCFRFRSQSVVWWPWTYEEQTNLINAANQLTSSHEGMIVEFVPFHLTAAERLRHLLPASSGWQIIVWELNNAAAAPSQSEEDILSCFKTRSCDETDQDEDEVCCICLDNLYEGSVTSLDCGHEFHPDCIRRWLVRGENFCPLCKATAIKEPLHLVLDYLRIN